MVASCHRHGIGVVPSSGVRLEYLASRGIRAVVSTRGQDPPRWQQGRGVQIAKCRQVAGDGQDIASRIIRFAACQGGAIIASDDHHRTGREHGEGRIPSTGRENTGRTPVRRARIVDFDAGRKARAVMAAGHHDHPGGQ